MTRNARLFFLIIFLCVSSFFLYLINSRSIFKVDNLLLVEMVAIGNDNSLYLYQNKETQLSSLHYGKDKETDIIQLGEYDQSMGITGFSVSPDKAFVGYTVSRIPQRPNDYPEIHLWLTNIKENKSFNVNSFSGSGALFNMNNNSTYFAYCTAEICSSVDMETLEQVELIDFPKTYRNTSFPYIPLPSWTDTAKFVVEIRDESFAQTGSSKTYKINVETGETVLITQGERD
jgi:hypothetical protein